MGTKLQLATALALGMATIGALIQPAAAKSAAPNVARAEFGNRLEIDAAAFTDLASTRVTAPNASKAALTDSTGTAAPSSASPPRKRYPHVKGIYADAPMAEVFGSAIF